jgi:hypothetical protein
MKMYASELCRISDVDLALEYLLCVEVGCVVDVSEEYAASK